INTEKKIEENKKILNKYQLEYNKECIDKYIHDISNTLKYQDDIIQLEKRNELLSKINKIPDIKLLDKIFTNEDLLDSLTIEKKIEDNKKICKRLGVEYDKKEIDSYINNIKNNLHNQENIINFEKRKKLTD